MLNNEELNLEYYEEQIEQIEQKIASNQIQYARWDIEEALEYIKEDWETFKDQRLIDIEEILYLLQGKIEKIEEEENFDYESAMVDRLMHELQERV